MRRGTVFFEGCVCQLVEVSFYNALLSWYSAYPKPAF